MATAIRLRRGGRRHAPYYRVIVTDSRDRSRGNVIEEIGVYQPCARPEPVIDIDDQRALDWLRKGAQPSDTVRTVFRRRGLIQALATGAELDTGKPEEAAAPAAPEEPVAEAEATLEPTAEPETATETLEPQAPELAEE